MGDSLPPLPETDGKILKSHLKQVLNSISIEPIHNFEEMSSDALSKLALRQQLELESPTRPTCSVQGPFLFGNDTDSVDVATRVAMAKFFNSVWAHHMFSRILQLRIYEKKSQNFICLRFYEV